MLQEEKFIPCSDTPPYGTRIIRIDAVFNYGMFNFNAPNFILRFALGETDYQLGVTGYGHFAAEYNYLGRDVWQQTLNLTQEEKERLAALLKENYRPENRVYRSTTIAPLARET